MRDDQDLSEIRSIIARHKAWDLIFMIVGVFVLMIAVPTVATERASAEFVFTHFNTDNGAGIPEAIRHKICTPFFTTKEPGKGTGQGLAIAHSIVASHGGRLWFESTVGVGTTFLVRLPIGAPAPDATAAVAPAVPITRS